MRRKNKAKIGTWITTYNPSALDVISKCNFDWICIDIEHSSITLEQLENLLNVLDKNKSNSFVRVSDNNKTEIIRVKTNNSFTQNDLSLVQSKLCSSFQTLTSLEYIQRESEFYD